MSIHVSRENHLYGAGAPNMSPSYFGQTYIDTIAGPRGIWVSTSEFVDGWKEVSQVGHKHTIDDFTDLRSEITTIMQEEGVDAAIFSLRGGNNTWEGSWNNFIGELRQNGKHVLSEGSSIGELSDVNLEEGLDTDSILGWNGSEFIPYTVTGASPNTEGGFDFGAYLRKDSLVVGIGSNDETAPLAASVATELYNRVKNEFADVNHTHTGFALVDHTHTGFARLDGPNTFEQQVVLGGAYNNDRPLVLQGPSGSRVSFEFPPENDSPTVLSFLNESASGTEAIISGVAGSMGGKLTLNFNEVNIPTGSIGIGENKKYLTVPSIKINKSDSTYVGDNTRIFGLDMNNSALIGLGQVVFKTPSRGRQNSILFPKNYAGNTQSSDIGLYHFLRLADGEMQTDTALSSEANYIKLGGRKIFFSQTEPGKEAEEGSIWIKC